MKLISSEREACQCTNISCLLSLGVATSIDAFLIGLVIAFYSVPFFISLSIIGFTTFVMSMFGCLLGNKANILLKQKAQVLAGVILLVLALKSVI